MGKHEMKRRKVDTTYATVKLIRLVAIGIRKRLDALLFNRRKNKIIKLFESNQ